MSQVSASRYKPTSSKKMTMTMQRLLVDERARLERMESEGQSIYDNYMAHTRLYLYLYNTPSNSKKISLLSIHTVIGGMQ